MIREWKSEYLEDGHLRTPKFFRDWRWGLKHVLFGARKRPIIFSLLVLANWTETAEVVAGPPLFLVRLLSLVMIQYLLYDILMASWNALIVPHSMELDVTEKTSYNEPREMAARLFGTNFLYGLGLIVLLFLLIAPGIWFAVTRSVSAAVVCIEKQKPGQAFGISADLVRGHFWRAFRYLTLGPLGLFLIFLVPSFILGVIVVVLFGEAIFDQFWKVVVVVGSTYIFTLQLSVMPLIVCLYAYLRDQKKETLPVPDPV